LAAPPSFVGSFQLVEGRVIDVATVRNRTYLNFGADWRRDFTISIAPKDRRRFRKSGVDPMSYKGQRIRVRGWLKSYNGSMIDVTHPEQFEILDEDE
jgi:micrococcal nuclease